MSCFKFKSEPLKAPVDEYTSRHFKLAVPKSSCAVVFGKRLPLNEISPLAAKAVG